MHSCYWQMGYVFFLINSVEMQTTMSTMLVKCPLRSDDQLCFVIKRAPGI